MKIVYLASAAPDLRWFKRYYSHVFPAGKENADRQFLAIQTILKDQVNITTVRRKIYKNL